MLPVDHRLILTSFTKVSFVKSSIYPRVDHCHWLQETLLVEFFEDLQYLCDNLKIAQSCDLHALTPNKGYCLTVRQPWMPTLRDLQSVLVCSFFSNENRAERKVAFAVSVEVSQPSVSVISQGSQQEKESSEFVHNDKWGRSSTHTSLVTVIYSQESQCRAGM